MHTTLRALLGALLIGHVAPAAAQEHATEVSAAIDAIAGEALDRGPIAGMSIAVVRRGEVVHARGYGWSDLDGRVRAGPRTVYVLASVSKLLASAAALHLVVEGRIRLDDDLAALLPGYPDPEQARRITLRHLLNHTSGIPDILEAYTAHRNATGEALDDAFVLEFLRDRPLDFEPGESWSYSNTGYYLVGMIIERASGLPFGSYMRTFFTEVAGLPDTFLCDDGLLAERRTIGYDVDSAALVPSDEYESSGTRTGYGAAGGLCSTAVDLAMLPDRLATERDLPAVLPDIVEPTTLEGGAVLDYGLGARLGVVGGHPLWGHTGGSGSTWAVLIRYPSNETTVAVLINTNGAALDAADVQAEVAAALLGLAPVTQTTSPAPPEGYETLEGRYESIRDRRRFRVSAAAGALTLEEEGGQGPGIQLRMVAPNTFSISAFPGDVVRFHVVAGRAVGYSVYYAGVFAAYRRRLSP